MKGLVNIDADTIMLQPFPQFDANLVDEQAINEINWIKELIVNVRNIRSEMNIAPSKALDVLLRHLTEDEINCLNNNLSLIKTMAKLESINILSSDEEAPLAVTKLLGNAELLIPMAGFIDKQAELARLTKELNKLQQEVQRIENKLNNEFCCESAGSRYC